MSAVGKIRVGLSASEMRRISDLVASGEFTSPSAVIHEALRSWFRERAEAAWLHGETCASTHRALGDDFTGETWTPHERVELLFDAADAKA